MQPSQSNNPLRSRSLGSRLRDAAIKTAVVFAMIEGGLRLLAGIGAIVVPDDTRIIVTDEMFRTDRLDVSKPRLFEPDADLLYSLKPSLVTTYARSPITLGSPESYTVNTNPSGLRNPEVPLAKPAGVFRIACLGDSSTFGYNLGDADAYPRVLERMLNEAHPGRFQVINFGHPGYTSRQGLEQLRRRVLPYQPDAVIMAFGSNDLSWQMQESDDERIRRNQQPRTRALLQVSGQLQNSALYRWMHYVFVRNGWIDQYARETPQPGKKKPRVSERELTQNLIAASQIVRNAGAEILLMNLEFGFTNSRQFTFNAAKAAKVPFVDAIAEVHNRHIAASREIERELQLPSISGWAGKNQGQSLLRVRVPPESGEIVVRYGAALSPETTDVPMYDDGSNGDQQAGDGIWSRTISVPPGSIRYAFYRRTPDGELVKEYRDTYIESLRMLPSSLNVIDEFGKIFLQSDYAHPDEEGALLVATLLQKAVLDLPNVSQFQ